MAPGGPAGPLLDPPGRSRSTQSAFVLLAAVRTVDGPEPASRSSAGVDRRGAAVQELAGLRVRARGGRAAAQAAAMAARRVERIGNRCMKRLLPLRAMPTTVPGGGRDRKALSANLARSWLIPVTAGALPQGYLVVKSDDKEAEDDQETLGSGGRLTAVLGFACGVAVGTIALGGGVVGAARRGGRAPSARSATSCTHRRRSSSRVGR